MARDKALDTNPQFLSVDLARQLLPGTFEHALNHLLDHEVDLAHCDARFKNDATGAPAYPPALLRKVVRFAYSQGIVRSRAIERVCHAHVTFMALCSMTAPHFTTIAHFVSARRDDIAPVFAAVLAVGDGQGLIGRAMFAIDGVKLPSNASKHRSGTRAGFTQRAEQLEAAAKMATDKGVIQGYTGVAAVDAKHQIIVDAQAHGTGAVKKTLPVFAPSDFTYDADARTCICPAGTSLNRRGARNITNGYVGEHFQGAKRDCAPCALRDQCLRTPTSTVVRNVAFFRGRENAEAETPTMRMPQRLDTPEGREQDGRRFATVEPVFANVRYNKRLDRFSLRGRTKVNGQWLLFCLVHTIETLTHAGYAA
ncbi:transposase [Gemmatimonas sp.]|uniref:transposase n=1 Tax=Gemmatimonas sp. TaxID=1962908 RepID=UPI003DA68C9C